MLCIPNVAELKNEILRETYFAGYSVYPGSTKIYQDLRQNFWWSVMKKEVAEFVSQCLICQQVNAEHQKLGGLMQLLPIPKWKSEHITMDSVTGLPRSASGNNTIWVIVDRLTESALFLAMKTTFPLDRLARLYVREVVRLYGVPSSIVSDRNPRFTSCFWLSLKGALGI